MTLSISLPPIRDIPPSVLAIVAICAFALLGLVYTSLSQRPPSSKFPVIALTERGLDPKKSFFTDAFATVAKGLRETNDRVFQIHTGMGWRLFIPNRFVDELKSHPALTFNEAFTDFWFMDYPGFEPMAQPMHEDKLLAEAIRIRLTQSLGLITHHVVEEAAESIGETFGEPAEWTTLPLKESLRNVIARISSRAFLGKSLCRDEHWLDIVKSYAIDSFMAAHRLRELPPLIRPVAHRLIPVCRRMQRQYRDAANIIRPEVQRRVARAQEVLAGGKRPEKTADVIGWMVEIASKPGAVGVDGIDFTALMLLLSIAGIHSTTEALAHAMMEISRRPEVVADLRKEIIQVVGSEGWTRTGLYKLRLMDSFLKEAQRFNPPGVMSMIRFLKADVKLSDGTILPAGCKVAMGTNFHDPTVYENPERFDAARFLKMRARDDEQGKQSKWQYVTTSKEHMGFGHGTHACPGRFLASEELKVVIAFLIMKYDWRPDPAGGTVSTQREGMYMVEASAMVQCKRRQAEVDLGMVLKEEV